MQANFYKRLILTFFIFFSLNVHANEIANHKIAVLVNDEIITTYDVSQRLKINAIINGINITPENVQLLTKTVVEDLIDENLMYQKSMENKIKVDENEYNTHEKNFFNNQSFSQKELIDTFKKNNIRYLEFKNFLINEIAWNKLIGSLYYRVTAVSDIEVEEIISKNPNISEDQAKNLVIQRQLDLRGSKLLRDMRNEATIEYKL